MSKPSLFAIILFFFVGKAIAGNLTFPSTEQEIVDALTFKDGTVEVAGVQYLSKRGRVYKVINGLRYRVRGMGGIVETDIVPKVGALILFDFDSDTISKESFALLDEYANALQGGLAGATLQVRGHTDSYGSGEYNLKLSRRRAESVRHYLTQAGVSPKQLKTKWFGETMPIESNATESGRAKNRRVEFARIE